MATQPGAASKLLFRVLLSAIVLVGSVTGALAALGALLQTGSSYFGIASMTALLGSAALGFGHAVWAARMFSQPDPPPILSRAGLYLGAVTVAGAVAFTLASFLAPPFMNPYIGPVFFFLCVLPQSLLGLVSALASLPLVLRARTRPDA